MGLKLKTEIGYFGMRAARTSLPDAALLPRSGTTKLSDHRRHRTLHQRQECDRYLYIKI
ncbi:hypothetical protein [Nostoc sp.]|uniref:hypothetical protein n=1 Tax=Nostoc sp. TaxID=1180 RepID=UPI002FFB279B